MARLSDLLTAHHFTFETEKLGTIQVGAFNFAAHTEIEKHLLNGSEPNVLAKTLLSLIGQKKVDNTSQGELVNLTESEIEYVSTAEFETFAELFIQKNVWLFDDHANPIHKTRTNEQGEAVFSIQYPPVAYPKGDKEDYITHLSRVLSRYFESRNKLALQTFSIGALGHLKTELATYQKIFQNLGVDNYYNAANIGSIADSLGIAASMDIGAITFGFEKLRDFISPPIAEIVGAANIALSTIAHDTNVGADLSKYFGNFSGGWKEVLEPLQSTIEASNLHDIGIQAHFGKLNDVSMIAGLSLSQIAWDDLGKQLDAGVAVKEFLQNDILGVSESYTQLFTSITEIPDGLMGFHPVVSSLPPIEFFNQANLLHEISGETPDENEIFYQELTPVRKEIQDETEDALSRLLSDLDPQLIRLWDGAKQALESKNPDNARHFATSLRELFTHVLHKLASDESIKTWTSDPQYFSRGRPTRRGRLLYICRGVNHGPFTKFVEKDVDSVLEFISLFQRGTHEIVIPMTEGQLLAMKVRMEGALRFLLETSKTSRS